MQIQHRLTVHYTERENYNIIFDYITVSQPARHLRRVTGLDDDDDDARCYSRITIKRIPPRYPLCAHCVRSAAAAEYTTKT